MYPYPILLDLGLFKIYSYGLFLALAFLTVIYLSSKKEKDIYNLSIYTIIGAIIGARLFYLIENNSFSNFYKLWEGGFTFYGGLLGAIVFSLIYIKKNNLDFWKIANIIAIYTPLGLAIGRIGCFLRGCCYGNLTNLPFGIYYLEAIRHPTQLYLSLFDFSLFLILRKIKQNQFLWFLLLYSIGRFFIDFLRVYSIKIFIISISQIISLIIFIITSIVLYRKYNKK